MYRYELSGWGNQPKLLSNIYPLYSSKEFKFSTSSVIPRGLGRGYGDCAINKNVLDITPLDRFLFFDDVNGIIQCQAGLSLAEILSIIVPKGWFLPVSPGSKFVTVGGAIAADVHGKNHHVEGSFTEYVINLNILTGSGDIIQCSPIENNDLFYTTCGGMGLTGIILDASFNLKSINSEAIKVKKIKTNNLTDTLEIFEENKNATYSVAWIDCLKKGKNLGRSIVMIGEHVNSKFIIKNKQKKINIPSIFPSIVLNKYSIKLYNSIFYNHQRNQLIEKYIHYDPYFYPLDSINNWNRLYGKKGFFQYQFVVPYSVGIDGMYKILNEITNWGQGSFLSVLKIFRNQNKNIISFPIKGYSLSIDIKYNENTIEFFEYLDEIILDMGGRLYLAKDSRMSADTFKKSYPNWEIFQTVREKYNSLKVFRSHQSERIGLN